MKNEVHQDAWELGTGMNYSINEVYLMFKEKFGTDYIYIPDQSGNYRVTLRENSDTLESESNLFSTVIYASKGKNNLHTFIYCFFEYFLILTVLFVC